MIWNARWWETHGRILGKLSSSKKQERSKAMQSALWTKDFYCIFFIITTIIFKGDTTSHEDVDLRLVVVGWILVESDLRPVEFDLKLVVFGSRLELPDLILVESDLKFVPLGWIPDELGSIPFMISSLYSSDKLW